MGLPSVLFYGRTSGDENLPVLVDDDGALIVGGINIDTPIVLAHNEVLAENSGAATTLALNADGSGFDLTGNEHISGTQIVGSTAGASALETYWSTPIGVLVQQASPSSLVLRSADHQTTYLGGFSSGGTLASPTVSTVTTTPNVGDDSLVIYGFSYDGSDWTVSNQINFQSGPGTISPGTVPGQMILSSQASSGPGATLTLMGDFGIQAQGPLGFSVCATGDDGVNFEHITTKWNSTVAEIGTTAGGTGTLRSLRLTGAGVILPSSLFAPSGQHAPLIVDDAGNVSLGTPF